MRSPIPRLFLGTTSSPSSTTGKIEWEPVQGGGGRGRCWCKADNATQAIDHDDDGDGGAHHGQAGVVGVQPVVNQPVLHDVTLTNKQPADRYPASFISDASAVTCSGPGLSRPMIGKQNSFTVDCNGAGNNVLFVGVYGPETPCDEVHVKHQGEGQYGVSYKLTDRGQYILYVKWGDDHIPGSPFHIEV